MDDLAEECRDGVDAAGDAVQQDGRVAGIAAAEGSLGGAHVRSPVGKCAENAVDLVGDLGIGRFSCGLTM